MEEGAVDMQWIVENVRAVVEMRRVVGEYEVWLEGPGIPPEEVGVKVLYDGSPGQNERYVAEASHDLYHDGPGSPVSPVKGHITAEYAVIGVLDELSRALHAGYGGERWERREKWL